MNKDDWIASREGSCLDTKTIGNRKRGCVWGCPRWSTPAEKICRSQSANQSGEPIANECLAANQSGEPIANECLAAADLRFVICRFSHLVWHRATSRAISFSITIGFWILVSTARFACLSEILTLIPKTIGNRKRDCAWGCAGVKKLKKNQLLSTNHQNPYLLRLVMICAQQLIFFNF